MPIRPRIPNRPKQEGIWKHWTLWIWFVLTAMLTFGAVMLWKSGHWLVYADNFERAPWAIVLAGETRDCERTDEAIRLFKEGRVDTIVLSACRVFKTRYSSEFTLDYMVNEGVPREKIFEFRQDAFSTIEEARLLIRQFRLQNLDSVLIITSNYHSARTHYIFKKLSQGYPHILVHPAEFHTFNPSAWWSNRESRKFWLDEWLKTVFTYFEVWSNGPEKGKADFQNLVPDLQIGSPTPIRDTTMMSPFLDSLNNAVIPKASVDSIDSAQGERKALEGDSSQDTSTVDSQELPKETKYQDTVAALAASKQPPSSVKKNEGTVSKGSSAGKAPAKVSAKTPSKPSSKKQAKLATHKLDKKTAKK